MSKGIPIRKGCELATVYCGDECACEMYEFCATHQEGGGTWPCVEQERWEQKPKVQVQILREQLMAYADALSAQARAFEKLDRDHARLTRIVEHAIVPFMRDALYHIGGQLQISSGMGGDSESLLGADSDPDNPQAPPTFNRGRRPGTVHGITYEASDGTVWQNGTRVPVKLVAPPDLSKPNHFYDPACVPVDPDG